MPRTGNTSLLTRTPKWVQDWLTEEAERVTEPQTVRDIQNGLYEYESSDSFNRRWRHKHFSLGNSHVIASLLKRMGWTNVSGPTRKTNKPAKWFPEHRINDISHLLADLGYEQP